MPPACVPWRKDRMKMSWVAMCVCALCRRWGLWDFWSIICLERLSSLETGMFCSSLQYFFKKISPKIPWLICFSWNFQIRHEIPREVNPNDKMWMPEYRQLLLSPLWCLNYRMTFFIPLHSYNGWSKDPDSSNGMGFLLLFFFRVIVLSTMQSEKWSARG